LAHGGRTKQQLGSRLLIFNPPTPPHALLEICLAHLAWLGVVIGLDAAPFSSRNETTAAQRFNQDPRIPLDLVDLGCLSRGRL